MSTGPQLDTYSTELSSSFREEEFTLARSAIISEHGSFLRLLASCSFPSRGHTRATRQEVERTLWSRGQPHPASLLCRVLNLCHRFLCGATPISYFRDGPNVTSPSVVEALMMSSTSSSLSPLLPNMCQQSRPPLPGAPRSNKRSLGSKQQ